LALTVLLVDAFKRNNVDDIKKYLPDLKPDGFGKLLKPLMEVWLSVSESNTAQAFEQLKSLVKQYPSLGALAQMHTAFVYDAADNPEEAAKYYDKALDAQASIRAVWLVAQFHERHNDVEKAIALYDDLAERMQGSPFASLVVQRLQTGKVNAESPITEPKHGVAAALYDVATVLHQENSLRLALLYGQLAHMLVPQDPFVNMLLGDIFSMSEVRDPAETYYGSIPQTSDFYVLSQMRLAQLAEEDGDNPKAISILQNLGKDPILTRTAETEIADIYRRDEDFMGAIPHYTKAIETIKEPDESDWPLYYARGICYERAKEWDKAETDLQQALTLSPQQPEVLNYLAYSWADSGKNLDQALEMLQNALAGAPDDPYITDSVGWALYKIGRFTDAVPYLEAAVQQLPADATINDHLGDIYWRVGRKLEAKFQWERALKNSTDKDVELKNQIQIKLVDGLPKLLIPVQIQKKEKDKVTENNVVPLPMDEVKN
jgi:tetratricopeptide (TPR) repeat protein